MTRRLKGGGEGRNGHYSPRPKKTSYYTSSLESREAVSKELELEQHEPEKAGGLEGAFELEKRVEHETGGVSGPEGATSEELEPEKSFLPEPGCYGRKSSAPNSSLRGSSNIGPTHACSGAYCAGKSSSSWYTSMTLLVARETKRGVEHLVASLTATPRSGVRSEAGTVFTPYRLQCGMLNLV